MLATVTVPKRVEWIDTDAAGIWHHSTLTRWAEEAEAELHRSLGIVDRTFGATPRVHVEFDIAQPLRFNDEADVTLSVQSMGESSIEYAVLVERSRSQIARGTMVAVLIDPRTGTKKAWPEDMRRLLGP